ncbi:MAG: glycosyltransferase [Campylobacterota bacterium]|nr:glycosyltransferase [Campylobacterota bacterium]
MKKIKIAIKNKTKLTQKLEELYDVTYYKKQSLLSKLTFKSKIYPDIYFHQGSLNKQAIEMIENSKITLVNTNGLKELIVQKLPSLTKNKIHILYPYLNSSMQYDEKIKQDFRDKYSIQDDNKLILFTANDLNTNGLNTFFKIISQLEEKNFKVIVYSDKKQIEQLKILINRLKIGFQVIMLTIDDITNKDHLFIISDIFLIPTKQKAYISNILKAMYYNNAIFLPQSNFTSEIIDTFSIMNGTDDPTTQFKIDALLSNNDELQQIQEINRNMAKNFSFDSRFEIIKSIISNNID